MSEGDCFPVAYNLALDKGLTLVHGIVTGQPGTPIEGVRHWHAWCELTTEHQVPYKHPETDAIVTIPVEVTEVIDNSQGKESTWPAALYYNLGRVDRDDGLWRYTRDEAIEMAGKTGHYGPWVRTPEGVR